MALKTEIRDVHDFTELALQGIGEITIEQDPTGPESLSIEADSDVLARITSRVEGGRLILGFDIPWYDWLGWGLEWLFTPNKSIRYQLKVKQLTSVAISGAAEMSAARIQAETFSLALSGAGKMRVTALETGTCRVTISGAGNIQVGQMQAQSLSSAISGAGDIDLAGTVVDHEARLSGAGALRTANLLSQTARVTVSGVGSAEVSVAQTLQAALSGAGSIRYHGSPHVTQSISGVGSITQA